MPHLVNDLKNFFDRLYTELVLIDYKSPSFKRALFFILFNPLFWNAFGRLEYHFKIISKLLNGNSQTACYIFGLVIFTLGLVRDQAYREAVDEQRIIKWLNPTTCKQLSCI